MNAHEEDIGDTSLDSVVGGAGGPPGTVHKDTQHQWADASHANAAPLSPTLILNALKDECAHNPAPPSHTPPQHHRP